MNEQRIHDRIRELVDQEHALRTSVQEGTIGPGEEQRELKELEVSLDQCWDLLRQRQARRDAGQDPDHAAPRPVSEVEGYLQ